MKTCVIIPVYNHEAAIVKVVGSLQAFKLPCFLVNDGSSVECSKVLAEIANRESNWVTLLTRPENGGKGAAVVTGFKAALAAGYTHAIQLDADGQHDASDVPIFQALSGKHPGALILGYPVFDASAPFNRVFGRKLTNFWLHVNTLSCAIRDGMCGFRLYPLAEVNKLIAKAELSQRMDFDIDIAVRLCWQGVPVVNLPTKVTYPLDGVSHFRLWDDNLMISKTHARLFFGMLGRSPLLLFRHLQ